MDIENPIKNLQKNPENQEEIEYLSDSEQNSENNAEEKVESDSEASIPDEILQEKIDTIMQRLEQLDVDKEIGEKEKMMMPNYYLILTIIQIITKKKE